MRSIFESYLYYCVLKANNNRIKPLSHKQQVVSADAEKEGTCIYLEFWKPGRLKSEAKSRTLQVTFQSIICLKPGYV